MCKVWGYSSAMSDLLCVKIKELEKGLNVEKSSRTDLEMYVAVLNTQKGDEGINLSQDVVVKW